MKKIFFETLKHKLGHYLLVIFCGILMVSTIYVSYAFSDSIEGIINGQNSGIVEEMYTFINFQETYILLFILMVLVIISYIRKKSYDYVLLDTMGLKKKHRYMFIGFEYAGIIFSSVTGGLILGKILAECAKTVLQNIFYNTITTEVNYGFVALRNTLVISCEVFGILFIVFDEVIACLGTDALLTVGKKNGKPLKKRPKTLLIGIFLILIGLISLLFYWGKISQSIPTVFLNAGMCLLMISLAGYYFVRLNKKEKKYYKRITWLENWYHRFFYNINMSFVVAAFLVIIMTDFSIKLLDNLPITEPKNYPFDLVWMANTDDEEFLNHLTDDEGVELRKVPCARVTTTDIAEHMGIPASTYEKWTGKSLDLKDNEIFVVYQRERFERNKVGIGYNTKNPLIYIGKARADLWLYIKGVAAPKVQYFTEKFKVVGTEDRILTGVFGSETCEHIIVFSDEYYQKNCVKADGANMAVMMNIPENYDKVVALGQLSENSKMGKISPRLLRTVFKVVIDDTRYEISCVADYIDYLKENIKRLELADTYYLKMQKASSEKKRNYYMEGMQMLFQAGENFQNYHQIMREYRDALIVRQTRINDLYNEIKIIKKLKL